MVNEVSGDLVSFILGGMSRFSIIQDATETSKKVDIRYKVFKCKDNPDLFFVHTECQGIRSLKYHGYLVRTSDGFKFKKGSAKISRDEFNVRAVKGLLWVLNTLIIKGELPSCVHVVHHRRCARCGRILKDEESLRYGLGPECRKKVGFR